MNEVKSCTASSRRFLQDVAKNLAKIFLQFLQQKAFETGGKSFDHVPWSVISMSGNAAVELAGKFCLSKEKHP
jgi:hypothetical protein